ncbi:flagellar hook assembly protein FlgD [Thiovibrio frasassiensis]|uniref:Basal-body rod modification protein FlgD n=1 Tax=Thiovibrio frasassiensis TaxID=2984131 RepID=A0A9X4MIJ8_9BACT|nr:flagellar hook assembly protein FlgD [Thiovibrio frasassiensis]MDG4477018.1 flagellar hook assembly protein FlgD [Thiovibrio frasassiensis]
MTTIATTSSTLPTQDATALTTVGKSSLDRNDFMTLFITQMQHQDPLEPMDSTDMASQLAQFSNMEATMKMSDNLEKLLGYQVSQNNLQLLTLIGKEVQGGGNTMGVVEGKVSTTQYILADAAESCRIEIYDAAGKMADTVELGYAASGSHDLTWDATTPSGTVVADGLYTYNVVAINALGQKVDVDYRSTGTVTGVNFDGATAQVTVDKSIPMNVADILVVK